ncbi:MAG TPA: glycoside hydrolase family 3 N-terminal domain-containing protein [Steroidobacteraceae bacterium]|nr:glycoside hydrolase family 3 N-terminal domain-containing protein [Steroidobacteraceae bacterium]
MTVSPRRGGALAALWILALAANAEVAPPPEPAISARVEALLAQMSLEEKVGQLVQMSNPDDATGPVTVRADRMKILRNGGVGSVLNVVGAAQTRRYQELALQSRLHIPLLFAQDVIHGYKTGFPIPLAEAASWDPEAIRQAERVAATEAAAAGVHWTFAPMVDIARDPRWGRVMEGAGEDPFLGARIAAARVAGFQGSGLGALDAVMACAKHFAAYGAAVGGRDYNSVDMSLRELWETYLPPFKAAADAGAATFMNSFNDLNGVPATANGYLVNEILKGRWNYQGFVVSDWGSIGEMVTHGYAADNREAARAAINAGNDMDMESGAYGEHLAQLVSGGEVPMSRIDDAVRRILRMKFRLGLFDDPFRYSDVERERRVLNDPAHAQRARTMARESIVLLKNEGSLLPLSPKLRTIAFIGPLVKAKQDNLGGWANEAPGFDYSKLIVSQWEGLQQRLGPGTRLLYAKGSDIEGASTTGFAEAVAVAKRADLVILSVGESREMSGEAKSRSNLHLPGVQEELIKAVQATGKPVVVLINAGRPLVFEWTAEHVPAILYTWWLGSEAGHAIADVLSGDYNPGGKLPMSFPRSEGQIPVYYNHFNTGRPASDESGHGYQSSYIDLPFRPRYAFGHGLSYTSFRYDHLQLDRHQLHDNEPLSVSFELSNTGATAGSETVQLYLRDKVASLVRPVQELKDFQKIALQPGESRTVQFVIDREKLSFYDAQLQWVAEPGEFELQIGSASDEIRLRDQFTLQ